MNRSLKLSMLLALALGSSQAVALELGQIQVKSALGQPLVAEIPVTLESPADLRNLSARLASDEDFLRAGITEGRARVPLSFSIVNGPGGSKLIRITSTDAINDPYLDLLVQVDNATGKSVREYTILLDPPGMAARPPAPVAAVRPRRAAPAQRSAPAPASAPRTAAPAPAPGIAAGSSVTVQRGQTLSAIAEQVKPAGADLNQTLLALKQANPDAFYRDNINALKAGAVLRVPTADEARTMAVAAALAEVRRQNSDWRAGAVGTPTSVADAATRAGASSSPTASVSKRDDHLELLPSAQGAKNATAGGGKSEADLRRDLQRSQESLATLQQQGADLRSRLKDLEDINSKNERLLSLKDSEIAELQRKLAAASKATTAGATAAAPAVVGKPMTSAPAAAASTAGKTAPAPAASAPLVASTAPAAAASAKAAAPVAASASASAKPVAAKPVAKPAANRPVPAPAGEPWYMQTWAWGAGAAAALLLLLLVFRGRRNKSTGRASGSSLADRFGAVPALGAGDADPDQDELLDQLAEHPDDISLHLELVSLYYHRRDVERFEAAAEAMYAHIADPQQSEWQDVAAMGEDLVPGHPLFAGVDTSVPEAERAPLGGLDLDNYDADADATVVAPAPPPMPAGPAKISEYHFDFNLTPRQEAARQAEAQLHDEPQHAFEHDTTIGHDPVESAPTVDATADIPSWESDAGGMDYEPTEFSDDPIDTKLDLARAYLDMGDADGARAMLEEVLAEGSQPQRDTARRLLDGIV